MKIATWRNAAIVLAFVCCFQRYRACTHGSAAGKAALAAANGDCHATLVAEGASSGTPSSATTPKPALEPALTGKSFYGFKVPSWVTHLAPQPGESMRAYRDRVLPLAQTVIAPQRARVARVRDDFAKLDDHQRAELDAAVTDAASEIENRVLAGFASGEFRLQTFKPMAGVAMAREILDIVDRGNTRFLASLTPEQKERLATHRFDFADYLLFSAKWEDALHVLD